MAIGESAAAALAVPAILVWFGSCLVGSFHPDELGRPYWPQIGGPRTDTSGVVAFAVLVCALAVSETLRVFRRHRLRPESRPRAPLSPATAATTGVAAAVLVASVGLVLYLSSTRSRMEPRWTFRQRTLPPGRPKGPCEWWRWRSPLSPRDGSASPPSSVPGHGSDLDCSIGALLPSTHLVTRVTRRDASSAAAAGLPSQASETGALAGRRIA
jgi:hypothetical protein